MGKLRADAKTRERVKKQKRLLEEQKRQERSLKIMKFTGVAAVCMAIFGASVLIKDEIQKEKMLYTGVIDWDTCKVDESLINPEGIERINGTIGFDAYLEYRKRAERESIEAARPVITNAMYENLLEGVESKYYYDSVQADYNVVCSSVSELVEESQWINALYDAYQNDIGIGEYDTNECLGLPEEDLECELKEIINTYTSGELHTYLMDSHNKWESLTNYRKEKVGIADSYTELLYQDSIVTDLSTIGDMDGEVYIANKQLYDKGPDKVLSSIENGDLQKVIFNEHTPEEALKQLTLYNDLNFYDGDFKLVTADTITALFAGDLTMDSAEYLGENLTEEELVSLLENKEELVENAESGVELGDVAKALSEKSGGTTDLGTASNTEESVEKIQDGTLGGYVPLTFSLTGYDENDMYYLFFKINNIEHDMSKVETYNSMKDLLEERSKVVEAQKDISAIITAEMNDLAIEDAEDIREFFPEFAMTDKEYEEVLEEKENSSE